MPALTHDEALAVLHAHEPPPRRWQDVARVATGVFLVGAGVVILGTGAVGTDVVAVMVAGLVLVWVGARAWTRRPCPLDTEAVERLHHVRYEQHRPSGKRILRDRLGQAWLPESLPSDVEFGDVLWASPMAEGEPFALVPLSGRGVVLVDRAERWDDPPA